jgi:hypothetical protein
MGFELASAFAFQNLKKSIKHFLSSLSAQSKPVYKSGIKKFHRKIFIPFDLN